ncbi:MAG: hypothetical protein ACRD8A_04375 [Candidatus Acidiferrales bacterium]
MDLQIARGILDLVRTEGQRRLALKGEPADSAYDQWLFEDEPFLNDVCLLLLVAVRHHVERELALLAACAVARVGPSISRHQYLRNVLSTRRKGGWKDVEIALNLQSFPEWGSAMETLRLLANCVKHEPTQEPDEELLRHLKLPLKPPGKFNVSYAPIPESSCFKEGLAVSLKRPQKQITGR